MEQTRFMSREEKFMGEAIRIGVNGMRGNIGGPFGCVIVKDDRIVGEGCNSVIACNDPTAHAEIVAVRNACKKLGTFHLEDCEVFTTCEPCPMCMAALYWARTKKIYYANTRTDAAAIGFDDCYIYEQIALPAEQRTLSMEFLPSREATRMFEEWAKMNNKTLY